jgi:uncharacterized HAD superfamily protein
MEKRKQNTIFCDIDGTLFKYRAFSDLGKVKPELIAGCKEKLLEWKEQGHVIIMTTARPEEYRQLTIEEFNETGLPYDQLVMNLGRGPRYLINDNRPDAPGLNRAIGISLERDEGIGKVEF